MSFLIGNPSSIPSGSLVIVRDGNGTKLGKFNQAGQNGSEWYVTLAWTLSFYDNQMYYDRNGISMDIPSAFSVYPATSQQIETLRTALSEYNLSYNETDVKVEYNPERLNVGEQYWYVGYRGGVNSILSATESNSDVDFERFEAKNYFKTQNHILIQSYAIAIQDINLKMRNCELDNTSQFAMSAYYYNMFDPTLELDHASETMDCSADAFSIGITSNADWEVRSDSPWIIIDTPYGTGNRYAEWHTTENLSSQVRHGIITVEAIGPYGTSGPIKTFAVHQLGQ